MSAQSRGIDCSRISEMGIMNGLEDVDLFKIYIQDCVLPGFRPLYLKHFTTRKRGGERYIFSHFYLFTGGPCTCKAPGPTPVQGLILPHLYRTQPKTSSNLFNSALTVQALLPGHVQNCCRML